MAVVVATAVGASMAAATGRPNQGHLTWAVNQHAYWLLYLTGTQSLSALYSGDGVTWTAPAGSPFALLGPHNSEGRDFAFGYGNIAGTDVLRAKSADWTNNHANHTRFTLGTTWTATSGGETVVGAGTRIGDSLALDSNAVGVWLNTWTGNSLDSEIASNADLGTSWTSGWGATPAVFNGTDWCHSTATIPLASAVTLGIYDNAASATNYTQINASSLTGMTWTSLGAAFGSAPASADANAWGAAKVSNTDVHVVALSNASNAYSHARYNGSAWAAGNAVPSLAYGTNSGVSLASDGTDVWAGVIDASSNVRYSHWTAAGGWGAWTTLEAARANPPAYLTGVYSPGRNAILWGWTESTGANYNIVVSELALAAGPAAGYPPVGGSSVLRSARAIQPDRVA